MAEMTPSDNNSPTSQAYGRKNKLGYTRISIACSHCRRRKIRCVASDDHNDGRCSNCVKLKKECVYTSVDATPGNDPRAGPSNPGIGSRTPSAVSSRSPSGVDPDRFHMRENEAHGAPSAYPTTPSGLTGNVGLMTSQGMGVSPNAAPHDAFAMGRGNVSEWQGHPMGIPQAEFPGQHYPAPWVNQAQQLPNYPAQPYHDGGPDMQYHYMVQGHAYPTRPEQWVAQEHAATMDAPIAGMPAYSPMQQQQMLYAGQYLQPPHAQGIATAPVVPSQSQYLAPGMNAGGDMESQHLGWNMYHHQQGQGRTSPSRHDSMAATWSSRGPSNAGRVVGNEKDQNPRARRQNHANEYPE